MIHYTMIRSLVKNYKVEKRTSDEAILRNKLTGEELLVTKEGHVFKGDKELKALCHNKKRVVISLGKQGYVYRYALVMYAFGEYYLSDDFDLIVNHKDNDSLNDELSNLELCNSSENTRHGSVYRYLIDNKVIHKGYKLTIENALKMYDKVVLAKKAGRSKKGNNKELYDLFLSLNDCTLI